MLTKIVVIEITKASEETGTEGTEKAAYTE